MAEAKEKMLSEKVTALQAELKAPKNQYNKFGGYAYRSCEDILTAVKPLLVKYGLSLELTDSIEHIGERYYVKATAIIGDSKTYKSVTAYAREEETKKGMDGSQITGSASSYARKYALNGLFLIDDVKDADATNESTKSGKSNDLLKDLKPNQVQWIVSHKEIFGVERPEEITAEMVEKFKQMLKEKK